MGSKILTILLLFAFMAPHARAQLGGEFQGHVQDYVEAERELRAALGAANVAECAPAARQQVSLLKRRSDDAVIHMRRLAGILEMAITADMAPAGFDACSGGFNNVITGLATRGKALGGGVDISDRLKSGIEKDRAAFQALTGQLGNCQRVSAERISAVDAAYGEALNKLEVFRSYLTTHSQIMGLYASDLQMARPACPLAR